MDTFGERLRALREEQKIGYFDLSIKTRIRERNIRNWERGQNKPHPENLRVLAEALGTTSDYLLTGK